MNDMHSKKLAAHPHRLLWVMAFSALVGLLSIALPSACAGGARTSTAYRTTTTAVQTTTETSIGSTSITTVVPPATVTSSNPGAINTGSGDRFTVPWAPPAGTSLSYLTFYNSLKYTNDWLWVRQESADTVRIGFTEYAELAVGNFWSVDILKAGTVAKLGGTFGFIQGEDTMDVNLQAPVAGIILEVNQAVLADYRLINNSPYDDGWLVTFKMSNPDDLKLLLTAAEYARQCCPPCHCNN